MVGGGKKYPEKVGCIKIGDNVFIGAGTSINYNVRIGSNVIIGACSMVTKDVPDNCVVAGVPARVIESFGEYIKKRIADLIDSNEMHSVNEELDAKTISYLWSKFEESK